MDRVRLICSHFQGPKGKSKNWSKSAIKAMTFLIQNPPNSFPKTEGKIQSKILKLPNAKDINPQLSWLIECIALTCNVRILWYTTNFKTTFYNTIQVVGERDNIHISIKAIMFHISYSDSLYKYWVSKVSHNKLICRLNRKKTSYKDDARVISRKKIITQEQVIRKHCISLLEDNNITPDYLRIDRYILEYMTINLKRVYNTKTLRISQAKAPKNKFRFKRLVNGGFEKDIRKTTKKRKTSGIPRRRI